jgi:hypothetical protein
MTTRTPARKTTRVRTRLTLGALTLCLLPALAGAQQKAQPVDDEEQMDSVLRKFGYVSGQACQCQKLPADKTRFELKSLDIATGILRLFGSDRAFFYAAAFGAGLTAAMEQSKCPEAIKQHEAMVTRLKVLGPR